MDREGLWYKMLSSRYGEESGRIKDGGKARSSWWREIMKVREGIGVEGGNWFEENIQMKIGNGLKTYFGLTVGWGRPLFGRDL